MALSRDLGFPLVYFTVKLSNPIEIIKLIQQHGTLNLIHVLSRLKDISLHNLTDEMQDKLPRCLPCWSSPNGIKKHAKTSFMSYGRMSENKDQNSSGDSKGPRFLSEVEQMSDLQQMG